MKRVLYAGLALLAGCRRPEPPPEPAPPVAVHCAAVVETTAADVRLVHGTVVGALDADAIVAPQVPGRLIRVPVREGDEVTAGRVVATVEARALDDLVVQARSQVAQADALVTNTGAIAAREERLFEKGISARQQVETARAANEHEVASAALARASLDVAQQNRERASVRAPMSGLVIRVFRREGELVDGTAATPLLEIADPNRLEFLATASPNDLVSLRRGQRGVARFDALDGRTFELEVRNVAPSVDPATGVGTVRLSLVPSDVKPPFGLFGNASITVGERSRVLVVPAAALRNPSSSGAEVVVCDGNVARVQTITVGQRLGAQVEAASGLRPGDRVVIDEVVGLEDGTRIRVTP